MSADALTFAPAQPGALAPLAVVTDLITTTYTLELEALTPLVHSSGNSGNEALFNRAKVADPTRPGSYPEEVPQISGNSLRHALRESLTWLTLREIGMELGGLSTAALHFLFSGGSMGKGATTLDVASHRALCELFPYLPMFGGGLGTSLVGGKLDVEPAILLCRQNARRIGLLCPALREDAEQALPAEEYTERIQGTRHDARRMPLAEHLLPAADVATWAKERLKTAKQNQDEGSDSTQMIYAYEAICAGARFLWRVGGRFLAPVEHSGLLCALLALQARGRIGAKSGTGHGAIRLRAIAETGESTPLTDGLRTVEEGQRLSEALTQAWAGAYVAHVREHAEEIRSWIGGLK